jgi:macrolide transport system ATP-binding/permease protein
LREGSRGSAGTTWRRVGRVLVAAELAIAIVVLSSAGLLSKSLFRLLHVDTGFDTERLGVVSVSPVSTPGESAPPERPGELARRVAERVAALPGVDAVGYADLLPLGPGLAPASGFRIIGRAPTGPIDAHPVRRVSAGYFTALRARLLRGRYFTEEEVAAIRPVMIINESARRRYFSDADPIGASIAFGVPSDSSPARTIVGVIDDITEGPAETPPYPAAYIPFDQVSFGLVARTSQRERSLLPSIAAAIREVRPDLLVGREMAMTDRMARLPSTELHRSSAWLAGGFAIVALSLGVVGLYGVVAYSVGQRTREIGVRMALGAQRRSVYGLVLGHAAWLIGAGTAAGIVCAVVVASSMRRWFFGIQAWDAPTLAATAVVLVVCAIAASYVPARRAAAVNPIDALRLP